MGWFRKKEAEVIRRGAEGVTEERKSLRFGGEKVEVRRVTEARAPAHNRRNDRKEPAKPAREAHTPTRRRVEEEVIIAPETGRKQMLVRVLPHQTQVVVLEGPVLVEHYVAGQDRSSLVGNIYLGKVRNVLPGMEAAFVDFGSNKNGVIYADDVQNSTVRGRHPRIEEALAEGEEFLVQVAKDAMGAKGARLTGIPSLAGRYLVLVPNSDSQGISRRLPDAERTRLREALDVVKPEGFGVIVRTAALHASAEEIASDIDRLVKSWKEIEQAATGGGAPRLIHEEPDLLTKVIREHFTGDFRRLLIDSSAAYEQVCNYLRATAPDLVAKVSVYAEEIGRQLRLRDIGGIIVIDFIDMEIEGNQQKVLRKLRETLAKDKTRTQVFDVSHLGLVEMTRKNVSAGLIESFSEPCTVCGGRGVILHEEAATHGIPVASALAQEDDYEI